MAIENIEFFMGTFPEKKRCDTKSPSGRCVDEAFYAVYRPDRPVTFCCSRCVSAALYYGTNRGKEVTITRIQET